MSQAFYLTVPTRFSRDEHPQGLHPDGWVRINADTEEEARQKAFQNFKDKWAFIYDEEDFFGGLGGDLKNKKHRLYPRGEMVVVS